MENPLKKAQEITALEKDTQEKARLEAEQARLTSVISEKDEVKKIAEEVSQKDVQFKEGKKLAEETIHKNISQRKEVQENGKLAAQELRSLPETAEILKKPEGVKEIFGESIEVLKELNESVKTLREDVVNAKKENLVLYRERMDQIHEKIVSFGKKYNSQDLYKEISSAEKNREWALLELTEIKKFIEEYKDNLGDQIKLDRKTYNRIVDTTLAQKESEYNTIISNLAKDINTLEEEKDSLKKGFFESQKNFDNKKDIIRAKIKDLDDKRNLVFTVDRRNVEISKQKIEKFLDRKVGVLISYSDHIDNDKIPKKGEYATSEEIDAYFEKTYTTLGSVLERIENHYQDMYDHAHASEETINAKNLEESLQLVKWSLSRLIEENK